MSSSPRALLSVTDKSGIVDFATELSKRGFELISTGGTAKALRDAGLAVKDVSEVTGFPEMLDGRVKTLHPKVHGGILGIPGNPAHAEAMKGAGIEPIAMVVVNLYRFEETVAKPHTLEEAIESIDIGGPTMIRAAAKNHDSVAIVVDPGDYGAVLSALDSDGMAGLRPKLAAKAFRHTAYYDSAISNYLTQKFEGDPLAAETISFGFRKVQGFRYGENPHQTGALYSNSMNGVGLPQAHQLWGKELSYNNITDATGAWELVGDMPPTSCAIIKHANPCGAAVSGSFADSYRLARESDPISAFGGIAAFNGVVDKAAAEAMTEKGNFLEIVIAEGFDDDALEVFKGRSGWGQDVRLLKATLPAKASYLALKGIRGGAVIQHSDEDPGFEWTVATELKPTEAQMRALRLQWAIVQHVKSNAIVVGNDSRLLGVGAGQMNRVQSVRLAIAQAGDLVKGAVLASDAFFPFPDSIETASEHGIAAIVQPGGSKKDADVIAKANDLGIAMCLTGVRHFNH
ncbi:MAG: bifunctional phosphoribosylaminoimidazolecarboxamide formyltransferase/IMP cyclohydrolase [Armatimonadetes bacterium]|nr:bifunctional phosphoribosylaminoimidazolecarboxamide formyltransferase/IMP cyclohydrolase [Armatimonadota bacterium]